MRSNVRSLPASWCAPPGPLFLRAENYRSGVLPQPATAGDSEAPARTHARDHCSRSACALRLTRWTRWSASGVVGWLRPVPRGSIPRSSSLVRKGAVAVTFEFLLADPVRGCPRNLTLRRLFPGDLTKYEFLHRGSLGFFPGLG